MGVPPNKRFQRKGLASLVPPLNLGVEAVEKRLSRWKLTVVRSIHGCKRGKEFLLVDAAYAISASCRS